MDFKYKCPKCGQTSTIPFEQLKKGISCPLCGHGASRNASAPVVKAPEPKPPALQTPFMDSLNEEQKLAACYDGKAGSVLVLAGAGCGKTRTMVARAIYLLKYKNVMPQRMAMLTFTRRAAREIQERLQREIPDCCYGVFAGTFHSFCLSLIHRHTNYFNMPNMKILDSADQEQLLNALRNDQKYKEYAYQEGILPSARSIASILSFVHNKRWTLDEYFLKNQYENENTMKFIIEIVARYEEYKKKNEYLDFDDILAVVADTLECNADFRNAVQSSFDHILVDEMQDTSPVQWDIIKYLYPPISLFCVGDDAQSIYGFRGADFESVHHFCEKLPNAVTLKLTENYRSTQGILDLANALLASSPLNYDRMLRASSGEAGLKPRMKTYYSDEEEAEDVCNIIRQKLMCGMPPREIMVLLRSANSARMLEMALNAHRVPYRMVGGVGFLQAAHVKDVVSTFEALTTLRNGIAWQRFLLLLPGIGLVSSNRITEPIMGFGQRKRALEYVASILRKRSYGKLHHPKDGDILRAAADFVSAMSDTVDNPAQCLDKVLKFFEDTQILEYKYEKWCERQKDLDALRSIASKYTTVTEFLEAFKLDPNDQKQDENADKKVTLITVHSAKGTEADFCCVMRVQSGFFPHSRASSDDEVEEERRVLYVALTRARKELLLTQARRIMGNNSFSASKKDFLDADFVKNIEYM
ncbi:MAG: UvrD-helicase domain-containing protein [Victivallales bacterium]|nr:UvrD-helicase domain-containing protein [Victivallales bacterium]